LMLSLLPIAQFYSHAPVSGFHVGAISRGASGSIYLGANFEIPGLMLAYSIHAEQSAVANAFMQGEHGIRSLAVTAAPCGHCRQFLEELSGAGDLKVLIRASGATRVPLLLPEAFGPVDLGTNERVFRSQKPDLDYAAADELTSGALEAAIGSYAPYTRAYSGIALRSPGGRIYKGSYLENAAFNPSLTPLQVALVGLRLAGESPGNISRAVLVELEEAVISQAEATRTVLHALAPAATLRVVLARLAK
jgi:cytidine deaminase